MLKKGDRVQVTKLIGTDKAVGIRIGMNGKVLENEAGLSKPALLFTELNGWRVRPMFARQLKKIKPKGKVCRTKNTTK